MGLYCDASRVGVLEVSLCVFCSSELFAAVCQRFPHSLSPDMLFAHCCWEHVVQWNKDPEVHVQKPPSNLPDCAVA